LVFFGFSFSYISEIQFNGDEFVEFYSDSFLNLSEFVVIDESGNNNTLKLVQIVNGSDFYLVVGDKFISNNNLDELNCTIYRTDKTQVSNGGLKSAGESFSIGNFSFNLSDNSYDFESGESLNLINGSDYVLPSSMCAFESSVDIVTEVPDENLSGNVSCGSYGFDVILKNEIILDKVEFKFSTNYSQEDYFVNYWIEDYSGEVVKNPTNSSSLNWKVYSPKGSTQILVVFGEFVFGDCVIESSSFVYFYSDYIETITIIKNKVVSSSESSLDLPDEPYIKLLNIESVLNLSVDYLDYEIYRGNSRKSVVNFYLNSKNILKLRVDKFSTISGRVFIGILDFDYLRVVGLDFDERYNFSNSFSPNVSNSVKNIKLSKKSNQFFEIYDLNQVDDRINFNVDSNIVDLENVCYVNRVRTVVSDLVVNVTGNISLNINLDKVASGDELKLLCKYRKTGLTSWNYESVIFVFSKSYIFEDINESISLFLGNVVKKKKVNVDFVDVEDLNFMSGEVVYSDKNINFIDTSIYFVFIGVVIFMIPLLIFW
jgi:hypothetical protein